MLISSSVQLNTIYITIFPHSILKNYSQHSMRPRAADFPAGTIYLWKWNAEISETFAGPWAMHSIVMPKQDSVLAHLTSASTLATRADNAVLWLAGRRHFTESSVYFCNLCFHSVHPAPRPGYKLDVNKQKTGRRRSTGKWDVCMALRSTDTPSGLQWAQVPASHGGRKATCPWGPTTAVRYTGISHVLAEPCMRNKIFLLTLRHHITQNLYLFSKRFNPR